ncbi:DNA primase [Arthrobacter sp. Hiyo6]|nr:DNA primase [Arthrobacter sp. Hiyo6]
MAPNRGAVPDGETNRGRSGVGMGAGPEARIVQLTDQLHGVLEGAISSPGRWHQLLDTSATLWRYSGGNVALLMAQREMLGLQPPTLVAGYREWQRHGRTVLKGEHALWSWLHEPHAKTPSHQRQLWGTRLTAGEQSRRQPSPGLAERSSAGGARRSSMSPRRKASPSMCRVPASERRIFLRDFGSL